MSLAIAGRGCGSMKSDALYLTWQVGKRGIPLKQLTLCPVWKLDKDKMGIKNQGVTLLPALDASGKPVYTPAGDLIYDVYDVVGTNFYKYKMDLFMEFNWGGLSRRIPKTTKLDLISGSSTHFLCSYHAAIDADDLQFVKDSVNQRLIPECFKLYPDHALPFDRKFADTCTAMWPHEHYYKDCREENGVWYRDMPSFVYEVNPIQEKINYSFGAFMALPVGQFIATTQKNSDQVSQDMEKCLQTLKDRGMDFSVLNLGSIDDEDLESEGDDE